MNASRGKAGYTLIELMVIVAIIGVSVVAFSPGFQKALADRRVSMATRELVRVGRRARAEALSYRFAYVLWIQTTGAGVTIPNRVRLLKGTNNSCVAQDWPAIDSLCPTTTNSRTPTCLENIDFGDGEWTGADATLLITGSVPALALCFAPSGAVYTSANLTSSNFSEQANAAGGFNFTFQLTQSGVPINAPRTVLFPLGVNPMVVN